MFWPLQENIIGSDELELLIDFIRTTKRFTQFAKVREFENQLCHVAGLQILRVCEFWQQRESPVDSFSGGANGWQAGDEVIVPALTWPTTVTPVMQAGFTLSLLTPT